MGREAYAVLIAVLLFGIWLFAELRARGRPHVPLHGGAPSLSIDLDDDERDELRALLADCVSSVRSGSSRSPGDGVKRRAVVEKMLRALE